MQDPLLPAKNQDLPANLQTSQDNKMANSKDEKYGEEAKNSNFSVIVMMILFLFM